MTCVILLYLAITLISFTHETHRSAICIRKPFTNETIIGLGVSNFTAFIQQSEIFVDKTMLIKEIIEEKSKIMLITSPPKFCKSINLDMIKTFLEIPLDNNGSQISPISKTPSARFFREGVILLPNNSFVQLENSPLISAERNILDQYQGKFPVMHLSLLVTKKMSYQDIFQEILSALSHTFSQHNYLVKKFVNIINDACAKMEEREKATTNKIKFEKIEKKLVRDQEELKKSLKFLSELLYEHYKKRIFALIDDYDGPLLAIINSRVLTPDDITKVADFLIDLYDYTLRDNVHLKKVILTGVFPLQNVKLMTDLDIEVCDAINHKYDHYYSFTIQEIRMINSHLKLPVNKILKAHKTYYGYRLNRHSNISLYNPWSIAEFFCRQEIEPYWEMTHSQNFFRYMFRIDIFRRIFPQIAHGKSISAEFHDLRFTISDLATLKDLFEKDLSQHSPKIFRYSIVKCLAYFCAIGYLTYDSLEPNTNETLLRAPNEEVAEEWGNRLIWYYRYVDRIPDMAISGCISILRDVITKNTTKGDELQTLFQEFFNEIPIYVTDIHTDIIMDDVRNYISLKLRNSFQCITFPGNSSVADLIVVKRPIGVILKIDLNSTSAIDALEEAKSYENVFKDRSIVTVIKFIGVAVSLDKKVQVFIDTKLNPAAAVVISMNKNTTTTTQSLIIIPH